MLSRSSVILALCHGVLCTLGWNVTVGFVQGPHFVPWEMCFCCQCSAIPQHLPQGDYSLQSQGEDCHLLSHQSCLQVHLRVPLRFLSRQPGTPSLISSPLATSCSIATKCEIHTSLSTLYALYAHVTDQLQSSARSCVCITLIQQKQGDMPTVP